MRRLLLGIAVLLSLLWGCNNESDRLPTQSTGKFEANAGALSRTTSSGLGVDNTILFLQTDTTSCAGQLVITANVPEVTLTWNVRDESNLDTTVTNLEIVDGHATLDLNWREKHANGNFTPDATAFINGIRLSDGTTSIYVYLILTANPIPEDFEYLLNYPSTENPDVFMLRITPEEVKMTESEGGVAVILSEGTAPFQVQTERIGAFTKINPDLIPDIIEDNGIVQIPFRWQLTPPDDNFKVAYSVYSFDTNLMVEAEISYTKHTEAFLTASPDSIKFLDAGGTQSIRIETNQEKWTLQDINNIPEWLSCSVTEGNKGASVLSLTAEQNRSMQPRSCSLNLKAGEVSQKISVMQLGLTPELNISYSSFSDIKAEGEDLNVDVVSNIDWQLSENIPEWLHPNISSGSGNGTIIFTVDPHGSFDSRTATVSITSINETPSISRELTFIQKGREFKVSPPIFPDVNAKGGNVIVSVLSNVNWQLSEKMPEWIHSNVKNGFGDGTISLSIDANDTFEKRTASVKIFTMDGATEIFREVLITQNQRIFNVTPTLFPNINPEGESVQVAVTSNVDWQVAENVPAWIRPSLQAGSDNGNITFVIESNTTSGLRTASVKLYTILGGVEVSKIVTFTQQNVRLEVSPDSYLNIDEQGGNLKVNVVSNLNWQITGNIPGWLHPSHQSGFGNGSINFAVEANNTFVSRSATVTISASVGTGVLTREVEFTQKSFDPYLTVSQSSFTDVDRGETILSTNISSNMSWEVVNRNNWIRVTPTNGSGDASLRITVTKNSKISSRTGTITVRSTNPMGQVITSTITIKQKGYFINGNHEGFEEL